MSKINLFILVLIIFFIGSSFNIAPNDNSVSTARISDSVKKDVPKKQGTADTLANVQRTPTNLPIDTAVSRAPQQTIVPVDTVKKIDSTLMQQVSENALTNTKLFIYILLSVLGLALFFYIFVITLFKTFHKKKSTRQSLLLSWNLFFIVTIIWIFIIWGLVAGFWTAASFMIVVIFLFIISLIMTIIAVKSK